MKMKKISKTANRFITLLLILLLCLQVSVPSFADIDGDTFVIRNDDDLKSLVNLCSSDTWSRGKTVILENDIILYKATIESIPSFGGTFEGNGHTISEFTINGAFSPCGLFSELQEGAVIKDLNVKGSILPSGSEENVGGIVGVNRGKLINCTFDGRINGKKNVGGIVGLNELTGELYNCSVTGTVSGLSHTGGVVGYNIGAINNSTNNSSVNTNVLDPTLSLDDINLDATNSLKDFASIDILNTVNVATDTGGICGYSTGMILGCTNNGTAGYSHIGYNVGGIAGRSCGYIANSINNGKIYGRKDVGGICGQAEPYLTENLSKDTLSNLRSELNSLSNMVNSATDDIDSTSETIRNRFDNINGYVNTASDNLKKIEDNISDYTDSVIDEVNRASNITSDVVNRMETITDKAITISEDATDGLNELNKSLDKFSDACEIGSDGIRELKLASDDLSSAVSGCQKGIDKISDGIELLSKAVTVNDKASAEKALDDISDGITDAVNSTEKISQTIDKLAQILSDESWSDEAVSELRDLSVEIKNIGSALTKINEAVTVIDDNIDINWDLIQKGDEDIQKALDAFSEALVYINDALEKAQSGIDKVQSGLQMLVDAVNIDDEAQVTAAIQEIYEGLTELANDLGDMSTAIQNLSDTLAGVNNFTDLINQMDAISAEIGAMATAMSNASKDLAKISEGIKIISQNISIDTDMANQGSTLVFEGLGDLSDSIDLLMNANTKLSDGLQLLSEGLENLQNGIVVNNPQQIEEALKQIHDALGVIAASISNIGDIMGRMSDTINEMNIWSDDVMDCVKELSEEFTELSAAIVKINDGVNNLKQNITVNPDNLDDGLAMIQSGTDTLASQSSKIEKSLKHLSTAFDDLSSATNKIDSAISDISNAGDTFETVGQEIVDVCKDLNDLFSYLTSVDKIQIPKPSDEISSATNDLYTTTNGISQQLNLLNNELSSSTSKLTDDIRKINAQLMSIINLLIDAVYDAEDTTDDEIISDISEINIDAVTSGKLYGCVNNSDVEADLNVGGVTGNIAIEYEVDPEDDTLNDSSVKLNKFYETKAIVQGCINNGSILSKKNYAGAVCGRMDLGLIIDSQGYGSVKSETGDYVGGIAGLSASTIKDSWAKCTLSGRNYIGGIVGCGNKNDVVNSNCKVTDCVSMVEIEDQSQFFGAVAGSNDGSFKGNVFVSDSLSGIDRLSYEGKAEQISYDELMNIENLPISFKRFKLSFVADDKVLQSVNFNYGDSFDNSIYPKAPAKDGYYYEWDKQNLEKLTFDTVVTANYALYVTTLASDMRRDDNRTVFFVEGLFKEGDNLNVVLKTTNGDEMIDNNQITEKWQISFPDDGQTTHELRYLPQNIDKEKSVIYIKSQGEWSKLDGEMVGSYLCQQIDGNDVEIAVIAIKPFMNKYILTGGCAAAFIVILLIIKKKKQRQVCEIASKN